MPRSGKLNVNFFLGQSLKNLPEPKYAAAHRDLSKTVFVIREPSPFFLQTAPIVENADVPEILDCDDRERDVHKIHDAEAERAGLKGIAFR